MCSNPLKFGERLLTLSLQIMSKVPKFPVPNYTWIINTLPNITMILESVVISYQFSLFQKWPNFQLTLLLPAKQFLVISSMAKDFK